MNQTVNAFINPDEDTKISDVLDLALNCCANWIFFTDHVPWIGCDLFHSQRNPAIFRFDVQHNGFNHVADGDDLGRMANFSGP